VCRKAQGITRTVRELDVLAMTRATCKDGGNDNNAYNDEELLHRRRRSLEGGRGIATK